MTALPHRVAIALGLILSLFVSAQPKPQLRPLLLAPPAPKPTPISGEVVDDETGQPIDRYIITEALVTALGQPPHFAFSTLKNFDVPDFTFERQYRTGGTYWTSLRISAPGYAIVDTEPVINDSAGNLKLRLKRAETTRIPVKLPDGNPLANGNVFVVDQKGFLSMGFKILNGAGGNFFLAPIDDAGNAAFTPPAGKYGGVVVADDGYAIFQSDKLPASLVITPWASLDITVTGIGEPSRDNRPTIRFTDWPRRGLNWLSNCPGVSFKDGQAHIANLFAGEGQLEMYWMTREFRPGTSITLERFHLSPGELVAKIYDLSSNSVIGVIQLGDGANASIDPQRTFARITSITSSSPQFEMPADIEQWPIEKLEGYAATWEDTPEGKAFADARLKRDVGFDIGFHPNSDHSFTVQHVPAGKHRLMLTLEGEKQWLKLDKEFDVTDGQQTDLGTLIVNAPPELAAGSAAPDIDCPMLNGQGRFRLSDHRGKVVLLDFWNTQCGPCIRQFPQFKKLHEQFAKGKQFELVSLAMDEAPITAYAFMKKNGYSWTQLFATGTDAFEKYQGYGNPWLILIGKDGRLIAKNPKAEELEALIEKDAAPTNER